MSPRKRFFQSAAAHPQQANRRAYVISEICEKLSMPRRTFFHLRSAGQLRFLEEIQPRLGRVVRYRADLVDRYLSGRWQSVDRPHGGRKPAAVSSTNKFNSVGRE